MTQPPASILLRIERLLGAGKQQEARLLLVEYLKLNPSSGRAWWLMSLTLTDIDQQKDCLQRAIRLDPNNEPARERLAKLNSQPPLSPSVSPFAALSPDEAKPTGEVPLASAWVAPARVVPETKPMQPAAEQKSFSESPVPVEPEGKETLPPRSKKKWVIVYILMAVFAFCAIASLVGYLNIQRKAQAQVRSSQMTLAVAQTLTSLPLPTLIPTWTASPTRTALPTTTYTSTPTITPTPQYTLTRTPRPASLIGPKVGLYAPDFSLTELATGRKITLSQFDGQPVLLFFWATWCPHCKNEVGSIQTIYETYKEAGLNVLAIDAGEDYATVTIFRSQQFLTFPILLDPGSEVQSLYNVDGIPRHFFISSSGRIAFIGLGEMTLNELKIQVDAIMRRYPTSTP